MGDCIHARTVIWEPHLAGARKCQDCGMVYNPNRSVDGLDPWFIEPPPLLQSIQTDLEIILRQCKESHIAGSEYRWGFSPMLHDGLQSVIDKIKAHR